jgi:peptidoglycan/LPS O-acetylase OafA/YrhL
MISNTILSSLLVNLGPASLQSSLVHFDVVKNTRKLLVETSDPLAKRLSWIHGARIFYLTLAICFHVVMGAIWTPYTHVKFTNTKPIDFPLLNEFSANMTVGISVNFVIGGMLAFVSWYPELQKRNGQLSFSKYIIARWLRTFPLIAGVILMIFSVPESLGSGPAWRDGWSKITENCLNNWWAEFAYISNHFDFRYSCLAHAWYMGADFQLYFCSFIIIILLYRRPKAGVILTSVVIIFSIIFQGWYLHKEQLNPICDYNTTDFERLFTKESLLHTRAFNYIPCYLIGIVLGFLIVNNYRISNKTLQKAGWVVFVSLGLLVHLIPMSWKSSGQRPSRSVELLFGSLQRTMYSLAFAYGFFIGSNGEAGFIHLILEAKAFVPLGRMSFSIFIGHFLIIWWDVFTTRNLFEFRAFDIVKRLIYTTILSIFLGYFIYLVFEAPFISYGKSVALRKETKNQESCREDKLKERKTL